MRDEDKTREQLIKELSSLRYRTAELEALQQAGGSTRVSGIYTELLGAGIEERAAELNAFNDQLLRKVEELKQKEEEIREVRDFLMNMFNTALEGFIVTDSQGSITMANETALRILGFSRGELVGKNTIELRPEGEEYQEKGKELIEKLFEDGFIKGVERTWRRKDGSLAELETNMVLLRDKAGNVKGSLASLRDITERKRAREKLIAYNMQLRSLASELSLAEEGARRRIARNLHDNISQSLAMAKMKLGVQRKALRSNGGCEALDDIYNLISQAASDIRSLILELRPPVLYELGFEAAIEWLIERTKTQNNVRIDFEYDKHPLPVDNEIRIFLFQTVRELLTNAVKHAQTDYIRVCIRRDNSAISVTVADHGVGFDPAVLNKHGSHNGSFGLFDIRDRTNYMGGNLTITSQPGSGTCITISVPLTFDEKRLGELMI